MFVRPLFAVGLLLAVTLSGCLGSSSQTETPAALPQAKASLPPLPADAQPFTQLLCQGGAIQALTSAHAKDCNFKATAGNGPAAEVSLAANPLNPLNLVGGSKDFTLKNGPGCYKLNVWSGVYWTFDGGQAWNHGMLPGYPGDTRKTALSEFQCASDPVVAFGPDGTLYYTSLAYTSDSSRNPPDPHLEPVFSGQTKMGVLVTPSRDGGATWDEPVLIDARGSKGGLDKQWLAVDQATGQVYLSYIDTGTPEFYVARSDDKGLTWTKPMLAVGKSANDDLTFLPRQFGQIGVGPGGVVHFTYFDTTRKDSPSGIYDKASRDGGQTWSDPALVGTMAPLFDLGLEHKYRQAGAPSLAVDTASDAVYVTWPTLADGGSWDIVTAASLDGGKTWSQPVRVNDDLINPTNGQWMAAIAVGPDHAVHATWLDYRDDPAGRNAFVYYAFSKDGGKTWSKNARVSDVSFDGTGGTHQSGCECFIGDYMGLVATSKAVIPFWADTRDARNDVFSAVILAK